MSRIYKDSKIYCCFTLNRLVSDLGIDLYQTYLEEKLDEVLKQQGGLSKEEIKHEIRSNHFMTNKVIELLEGEGLVEVESKEGRYMIKITKAGVLYIRKYNEFFQKIYEEQIREHYRYRGIPYWARRD